jgi:tRNA (guanine-N7-)-methyltransferase
MELTSRSPEHFNKYAVMADQDFANWVYTEDRATPLKGLWHQCAFGIDSTAPIDLEIGVGNGFFFEHLCTSTPNRNFLGIELKYKPLIQTIRRTLKAGAKNARVIRFDASHIDQIFASEEISNVYIFFPDPWPKKRHHKNRLLTTDFLTKLFEIQRNNSTVEIKTDSVEYFKWIVERATHSPYAIEAQTENLHESAWASHNFLTHFERLWTGKGLKTHYLVLRKSNNKMAEKDSSSNP